MGKDGRGHPQVNWKATEVPGGSSPVHFWDTHCSWKRRRIFCQGLGQQASLFCHSRRLWAEGSSPLWQDFHRGDNQFRWNCVSVSLGPGFGWNCVSASLGPGFRWNCISAPRCPFAFGGARQSVIIWGPKSKPCHVCLSICSRRETSITDRISNWTRITKNATGLRGRLPSVFGCSVA